MPSITFMRIRETESSGEERGDYECEGDARVVIREGMEIVYGCPWCWDIYEVGWRLR